MDNLQLGSINLNFDGNIAFSKHMHDTFLESSAHKEAA